MHAVLYTRYKVRLTLYEGQRKAAMHAVLYTRYTGGSLCRDRGRPNMHSMLYTRYSPNSTDRLQRSSPPKQQQWRVNGPSKGRARAVSSAQSSEQSVEEIIWSEYTDPSLCRRTEEPLTLCKMQRSTITDTPPSVRRPILCDYTCRGHHCKVKIMQK